MDKEKLIVQAYNKINYSWQKYLKDFGVRLPALKKGDGTFTKNGLVLVYLYQNLGKKISKEELTKFLLEMGIETNDVQQGRHLAAQLGWYILSGTRNDMEAEVFGLASGEYLLKTIREPYPSFKVNKRQSTITGDYWDQLKGQYENKCATCGSEEGQPNRFYPSTLTTLQKGHMDPNKALGVGNIIPQCSKCNQPDRNYFIFDEKGRVKAIADPRFILRSPEKVQIQSLELLIKKYPKEALQVIESTKGAK